MKGETRPMQVYLLRHGIAEEGGAPISDSDRSLTNEGRRKLRQVLTHVADAGIKTDLIISSPLKRAQQTAEIARSCLKCKEEVLFTRALIPGASPESVWEEIRVHSDQESLLLVGHNPLFSNLTGYLMGSHNLQVDFKKGAVMCIDFGNIGAKPHGILRWYLTARLAGSCE
jgi:phosphohistidine phosphatase